MLDVIVTMPQFFRDANCVGTDPEAFHPEHQGDSPNAAKNICGRCPIIEQCALYALARPELSGVWGGLTDRERGKMREAARKAEQRQAAVDAARASGDPVADAPQATFSGAHGRPGPGGAAMHRRLGERPCAACQRAESTYGQQKREARQARGLAVRAPRTAEQAARQAAARRAANGSAPGGFTRYQQHRAELKGGPGGLAEVG